MRHDSVDRGPRATTPPCPRCGGTLARVHRRAADHCVAAVRRGPVYRYQCRSAACHWGGLLAPAAPQGGDRRRPLVAGAVLALAVAAAAVGLIAGMPDPWGLRASVEPAPAQRPASVRLLPRDAEAVVLPAGWHAVGEALPLDDARQAGRAAGLQLRHGCTWGVPGRDPYRGTAEQALQAAGLPAEAVRVLAQRIQRGESDGVVTLARDGIQSADGQRHFGRRLVASTYGMTLCFDTLVNFAEGHVERAPLFEFTSAEGRRFSVIVPDVCGNVGVISESPPAGIVLGERAERTLAQAAPGTADAVAPPVAPQHADPTRGPVPAGPPAAGAGGRTPRPAPPTGRGADAPPPKEPAPGTPASEATPPAVDPGPGAQPAPSSGDAPSPQDTPPPSPTMPPKPGDPTLPAVPAAPHMPPPADAPPGTPASEATPPAVDPGPGTPPVPGDGDASPPQDTMPPQPTVPPTPGGPKRPDAPESPEPPPPPPPETPTWLTPEPPWGDIPPLPPSAGPVDPAMPQPVPAPGTLSTSLLGLAALVLSRRWRRRRPR